MRRFITLLLGLAMLVASIGITASPAGAAVPPTSYTQERTFFALNADGTYTGSAYCLSTAQETGFGPLARCIQKDPTYGAERVVHFSPTTYTIYPIGDWYAPNYSNVLTFKNIDCANSSYTFFGRGYYNGSLATYSEGYIYRQDGADWQAREVRYNHTNDYCYTQTIWRDITTV